MKFKLIIIFVFYFACFNYRSIDAEVMTSNLHIYNMDVGNNYIVYEYQKSIGGETIHYIGLYNKLTNYFFDITNNVGDLINDDMFFPSISLNDEYLTFTSRATNISEDETTSCFNVILNEFDFCSNIYVYDINKKESYLIKNGSEYLNGDSYVSKISGDGSVIVFESNATNNLNLNKDTDCYVSENNLCTNIFKYNRFSKTISLVSSSSDNKGGNSSSISPSISYDGRYISFQSSATNLLNNRDLNGSCKNIDEDGNFYCSHIYLFDAYNNEIKLISKTNKYIFNDSSGNAKVSGNGKIIVYESYATNIEQKYNNKQHVIIYDIEKKENIIASKNNGILNNRDSYLLDVSYDGKYILVKSNSTNLNENGKEGVYVYNINGLKLDFYKENIEIAVVNGSYVYSYGSLTSEYNLMDNIPPVIEKNQTIYILKDSNTLLRDKVVVRDNLSSEIGFFVEDNLILNKAGNYSVFVTAVDEFGNYSKEIIEIVVLEEDKDAPVFNDLNDIKILKGSTTLNLSNYLNAVDKIDGNTKIYIIDDGGLNLNIKGTYIVKVMSKDNSDNKVYKEIEIIVYENYNFEYIYEILLILGIAVVIIFSIIKVK